MGCAQVPTECPESVAQARAAALSGDIAARRRESRVPQCYVDARVHRMRALHSRHVVRAPSCESGTGFKARIIEALCKGCGTCVVACPSRAIMARQFTDKQLTSEIRAALEVN